MNLMCLRLSCIGFICLLGCAEQVASINSDVPGAQHLTNSSGNGELLDKKIIWHKCMETMPDGTWRQKPMAIPISAINLKLHTNPNNIEKLQSDSDTDAKTVIGRLVPYIISGGKELVLLPEVPDKLSKIQIQNPKDQTGRTCQLVGSQTYCTQVFNAYFPACDGTFNGLAREYFAFYPLARLTVANKEQAYQLGQVLQEALGKGEVLQFLPKPLPIQATGFSDG